MEKSITILFVLTAHLPSSSSSIRPITHMTRPCQRCINGTHNRACTFIPLYICWEDKLKTQVATSIISKIGATFTVQYFRKYLPTKLAVSHRYEARPILMSVYCFCAQAPLILFHSGAFIPFREGANTYWISLPCWKIGIEYKFLSHWMGTPMACQRIYPLLLLPMWSSNGYFMDVNCHCWWRACPLYRYTFTFSTKFC